MARCSVCQGKGHGVDAHGTTASCEHCHGTTAEPTASELRERNALRHKIAKDHPVIGDDYRLLSDTDALNFGDQFAYVSSLLSLEGGKWHPVHIDDVFQLVGVMCGEESNDADCQELIFRRLKNDNDMD